MGKYADKKDTEQSDDGFISSSPTPGVRLQGSHSSPEPLVPAAHLRPQDDDDPKPDDRPPKPPTNPPLPVSAPDVGLHLAQCLSVQTADALVSAFQQAFGPTADVRSACIQGTQRIGIWTRPVQGAKDDQARDRGLEKLKLLKAGESQAFFINASFIRRIALEIQAQQPKRLGGNGLPDPNGPIHLTAGPYVLFKSPDRVVSHVDGFDERPWPDVSFQTRVTDVLSLSGGQVRCDSSSVLDTDTSWHDFLTGTFLVLFLPVGLAFLAQRIIIGSAGAPPSDGGLGALAASMIPGEILLVGGLKAVATYSRLRVSDGGIEAGGTFDVIPRSPEVRILGPAQISVEEGASSVTRTYGILPEDLRGNLFVQWSGSGTPSNPNGQSTGIQFSLGGAEAPKVLIRRIAVQVRDSDGLLVTAELDVRIHVTPSIPDFPPVCKNKPWLPQCKGPMSGNG